MFQVLVWSNLVRILTSLLQGHGVIGWKDPDLQGILLFPSALYLKAVALVEMNPSMVIEKVNKNQFLEL